MEILDCVIESFMTGELSSRANAIAKGLLKWHTLLAYFKCSRIANSYWQQFEDLDIETRIVNR
jgi:hypothetical protein